MTIANGMSNNQAEREVVLKGFREQIEVVEKSQLVQEASIKAKLYDIITDYTVSEEESRSLKAPYITDLENIEEVHERIRRSIFIGLYSFFEISLSALSISDNKGKKMVCSVSAKLEKKLNKPNKGVLDYFAIIYGDDIPVVSTIIGSGVRELRNYMVHGSMDERRENAIMELMQTNADLRIKRGNSEYYFSDYSGLKYLLEMFEQELNNAENKVKAKIK